jgi:soluble lytic murein transglycosylase-like protein
MFKPKLSGIELFFIASSILYLLTFCGYSLTVYSLETELKASVSRTEILSNQLEVLQQQQKSFKQKTFLDFTAAQKQRDSLSNRTLVLESSLDSHETRWARIKLIRDAIKEVSTLNLPVDERTLIASAVVDYSDEYDVAPSLVLGVIRQESNFYSRAISKADAKGIMQILQSTSNDIRSWLGVKHYSWSNPNQNIRFGTLYLARMLAAFEGNETLAVASYNCGAVCVEHVRAGTWRAYPVETQDYIEKVARWKTQFESLGVTWR